MKLIRIVSIVAASTFMLASGAQAARSVGGRNFTSEEVSLSSPFGRSFEAHSGDYVTKTSAQRGRSGGAAAGKLSAAHAPSMTPAQRLDHLFSRTRTLSAHFSETVRNANAATVKQSSGTLAIAKPGRFRWNYEKPYRQLIVADGTKLWLYDPGLQQVTVRPETRALAAGPAALLAGTTKVEDQFKVSDAGMQDRLHWVRLVPLNGETDYTAMRVGLDSSGQLKELQLDSKLGQTTRIVFSDLKRNIKLDPDLFKFTPPKGADVVHQQSPAAASGG